MNDKSFNNNFFTEENSPVPLISPDQAWEAMQVKLNNLTPGQRKRRMILWLPPVGCALLLLLLLGGGYGIWMYTTRQPSQGDQDKSTEHLTAPVVTKNKEPRLQKPTNNTATQKQPDMLSYHNTSRSSGNTGVAEKVLLTSKTTAPIQPVLRRNSVMRSSGLRQEPKLPEEETVPSLASASAVPANILRPSTVAGTHYQASISVWPARAPKPGWLPGEPISDGSSGKQPAHKYVFAAGLQVEIPDPVSAIDVYFKNPDVKDRFYQPLIPGIWASLSKNRHRFTAEFKPFASALLPNRPFDTTLYTIPGTGIIGIRQRAMLKVFGMQMGINYSYQVRKHWWLGAGLTVSAWHKALIYEDFQDDSLMNLHSLYGVKRSEASYLHTFQPGAMIQLGYQKNAWEGMLQLESPFNATAKGGPHPVWIRLGLRWRIWQSKTSSAVASP